MESGLVPDRCTCLWRSCSCVVVVVLCLPSFSLSFLLFFGWFLLAFLPLAGSGLAAAQREARTRQPHTTTQRDTEKMQRGEKDRRGRVQAGFTRIGCGLFPSVHPNYRHSLCFKSPWRYNIFSFCILVCALFCCGLVGVGFWSRRLFCLCSLSCWRSRSRSIPLDSIPFNCTTPHPSTHRTPINHTHIHTMASIIRKIAPAAARCARTQAPMAARAIRQVKHTQGRSTSQAAPGENQR